MILMKSFAPPPFVKGGWKGFLPLLLKERAGVRSCLDFKSPLNPPLRRGKLKRLNLPLLFINYCFISCLLLITNIIYLHLTFHQLPPETNPETFGPKVVIKVLIITQEPKTIKMPNTVLVKTFFPFLNRSSEPPAATIIIPPIKKSSPAKGMVMSKTINLTILLIICKREQTLHAGNPLPATGPLQVTRPAAETGRAANSQ